MTSLTKIKKILIALILIILITYATFIAIILVGCKSDISEPTKRSAIEIQEEHSQFVKFVGDNKRGKNQ